jgi:hypothetical protein
MPDLSHLRNQAKDLLRGGGAKSLSEAQFKIARRYGFASWTKLKLHVDGLSVMERLKQAINDEDVLLIRKMLTDTPALHKAPIGYGGAGALTWLAEGRVPWGAPSAKRLEIATWMIEHGSDVHQSGKPYRSDAPLIRASLFDCRLPMVELLVRHGADVHVQEPVPAACETLAPRTLKWLIDHGCRISFPACLRLLIATYFRDNDGKHACIEVLADAGMEMIDTPMMAFHRGRIDLLERLRANDPTLLRKTFSESEIFPRDLGFEPGECLHGTHVGGGTLLHLAVEYCDLKLMRWLIQRGSDADARAAIDAEGFGGQSPLFHAVVSGSKTGDIARLLLDAGADPNARATIRKQLRYMGDRAKERMREYHDVTPVGYARIFMEPGMVNEAAVAAIRERGGLDRAGSIIDHDRGGRSAS